MYVCMHACMYVCMYVRAYVCTYYVRTYVGNTCFIFGPKAACSTYNLTTLQLVVLGMLDMLVNFDFGNVQGVSALGGLSSSVGAPELRAPLALNKYSKHIRCVAFKHAIVM